MGALNLSRERRNYHYKGQVLKDNYGTDVYTIDLGKFLKVLWQKIWIVVIAALIGGGIAFSVANFFVTPLYESSVMIFVNKGGVSLGESELKVSSLSITSGKDMLATYQVIMTTRETLERVIDEAGLHYTPEELEKMLSSFAVEDTGVMTMTCRNSDPEEAALIVNTLAKVLPDRISEIVDGTSVRVVEKGIVNTIHVYPNITRTTEIGILLGAVLAIAIVFALFYFDSQIHDESFVDDLGVDLAILSSIPDLDPKGRAHQYAKYGRNDYRYAYSAYDRANQTEGDRKGKKSSEPMPDDSAILCKGLSFAASEAYKLLRTNLQYSLSEVERNCKVVGVTSSIRGEGKSTTSVNLAYTIAESGKKVLLLEADLRLPNVARRLKLNEKPGVSNVLASFGTLEDAVQSSGVNRNLSVLVAGTIPPNPSELLGSERMKALLERFKSVYDYVVVDLPPVNVVSDALTLSEQLDGVLLIVRQDYCDYPSINEAIKKFSFSEANLLGFVMTHSTAAAKVAGGGKYKRYKAHSKYYAGSRYGYGYGKGYGYGYGDGYGYGYGYGKKRRMNPEEAAIREAMKAVPGAETESDFVPEDGAKYTDDANISGDAEFFGERGDREQKTFSDKSERNELKGKEDSAPVSGLLHRRWKQGE